MSTIHISYKAVVLACLLTVCVSVAASYISGTTQQALNTNELHIITTDVKVIGKTTLALREEVTKHRYQIEGLVNDKEKLYSTIDKMLDATNQIHESVAILQVQYEQQAKVLSND